MQNSSVALFTAIATAIVIFLFTSAWVAAKAARTALVTAKAAVGPARKGFWSTIGGVIKMGALVVVLALVLVAWQSRDAEQAGGKPVPAPSASRG